MTENYTEDKLTLGQKLMCIALYVFTAGVLIAGCWAIWHFALGPFVGAYNAGKNWAVAVLWGVFLFTILAWVEKVKGQPQ